LSAIGRKVGANVGANVGPVVGLNVGLKVGAKVGLAVGKNIWLQTHCQFPAPKMLASVFSLFRNTVRSLDEFPYDVTVLATVMVAPSTTEKWIRDPSTKKYCTTKINIAVEYEWYGGNK
jgi:hypothetical protein